MGRQYEWFIHRKLNIDAVQSAIRHIIGTHDFKAFEGAGSPRASTVRTVMKADLFLKHDGHLFFEIEADGFLKNMVRNLVGTLVFVGIGKIEPDRVKEILLLKDRTRAGPTAPPHGLFLKEVKY
ncbi:MAG: hypothetical protein A2V65_08020 [Deltaproteobacteria bacterium RBG_13_49_15]|nr:MAG: hypothetical protein A2V65_08020 [Deltaproteobacteria bacterium RBG_13_49_15]